MELDAEILARLPTDTQAQIAEANRNIIAERLAPLNELITKHPGEQILLLESRIHVSHHGGCFGGSIHMETPSMRWVGVLTGEPMRLEDDYIIPTTAHVAEYFGRRQEPLVRTEGPIVLSRRDVELYFTTARWDSPSSPYTLRAAAGNAVVPNAFRSIMPIFWDIIVSEGLTEPPIRIESEMDLDYVTICDLLQLPVPEDFQSKYNMHMLAEESKLVSSLSALFKDNKQLEAYLRSSVAKRVYEKNEAVTVGNRTMPAQQFLGALYTLYGIEKPAS